MKRLVAAALVLASSNARAGSRCDPNDNVCCVEEAPAPKHTAFDLVYPPRMHELTVETRYVGSSAPVHSSFALAAMYSFAPFDQRLHIGARVGLAAGRWGADDRGPLALTLGMRVAVDFARRLSGLVDVFVLGQADVLLFAGRGPDVLRPAVGFGVRLARAVALEATFEPIISLGRPFVGNDTVAGGFGLGASFDLCTFFCGSTDTPAVDEDLTAPLYARAASLANPQNHGELCAAVAAGMDPEKYFPHDQIDPTRAFLEGVLANLKTDALVREVGALLQLHEASRRQLTQSRDVARGAAKDGRHLIEHCSYAPFPIELRAKFGCD